MHVGSQDNMQTNVHLTCFSIMTIEPVAPLQEQTKFWFPTSTSMVQSAERYSGINKIWVLLDSQSNCDIFCNSKFLTNIRYKKREPLQIHSNGGHITTNMKGDIKNYLSV